MFDLNSKFSPRRECRQSSTFVGDMSHMRIPGLSDFMSAALSSLSPVRSPEVAFFISTGLWSQGGGYHDVPLPSIQAPSVIWVQVFLWEIIPPAFTKCRLNGHNNQDVCLLWSRGRTMTQPRLLGAFFVEFYSWTETNTRRWPILMKVLWRGRL